MATNRTRLAEAGEFLRQFWLRVLLLSAVLAVPCCWHRRIEAGDLASHVYNAWLAQLIERGQAPGLYLASRWYNVLFDFTLLRLEKLFGFSIAEKIAVHACVLIFFWGVFSLVSAVTDRAPWFLAPGIAMLAYGYSFNMGFMNYYLSLGLACFALALFWGARGREWIYGAVLLPLVLLAHPIGFLWLAGTLAYVKVRARLTGWWKFLLPVAVASGLVVVYRFTVRNAAKYLVDWDRGPFYFYNGADQLALYGKRYFYLAGAALLFGIFCVGVDFYLGRRDGSRWRRFELPFELYVVAFCATALLPENLRPSPDGGWIGLLGSRLTTISAMFGLCVLGLLKPRKWQLAGFAIGAVAFFACLYEDTGWMDRLEAHAEQLVGNLTPGTRVIATVWAPPGSRIPFAGHAVERACIEHCFSYANYEAASGEFRVRVRKGSPVATSSTDDAEDMASGEYEVDETDLPLKQIYQCDAGDLTKLCIRELQAGETNGRLGYKPASR
jgi:hypothetical protein